VVWFRVPEGSRVTTVGRLLRGFWIAPLVAAALLWAAFPPVDLGFCAPLGFAVLLASMRLRGGEKSGRQALVFGMAWFLAGIWWIAPLVSAGWVFVAFWCAAHEALFARFLRPPLRAARDGRGVSWIVAAPLLHVGLDMVRTTLFTGFPWLLPGYSGWRNPLLLGSADLIGVHGATLAIVALGAGLAEVVARRVEGRGSVVRPLVPAAALWAALGSWALVKPVPETRPGPTFLLLQASLDQQLKEDLVQAGRESHGEDVFWATQEGEAARGLEAAADAGRVVDVVVWPETMVPDPVIHPLIPGRTPSFVVHDPERSDAFVASEAPARRLAKAARGRATLAGILQIEYRDAPPFPLRNTAILLDGDGRLLGSQDKQHLTPGGETLLFLDWLPEMARVPISDWLNEFAGFVPDLQAGAGPVLLPLTWRGGAVRVGVLVCYESIFPEIPRAMVRDGADVLVNVANYGWFTGTPEMEQALAMAAFRAAELRRPLVLASNNGISAVVGPDGRVRERTEADVRTFLLADVPLASGTTPFAVVGEWAAWGLGLAGALVACAARARKSVIPVRETS
jgi:apolipoprotein N-acyltransferase